jgi:hypothetical protein
VGKSLKASRVLVIVSVIGLGVSMFLNGFVLDEFDAYGEVHVPGTRTLHLPAGDVTVSFHSLHVAPDGDLASPQDLELTITPPSGVAQPNVTEDFNNTTNDNGDAHRSEWVAHIAQAGDYTITANWKVTEFDSPRLSFGHPSRFWFLPWLFGGLFVVSLMAFFLTARRQGRTRSAVTGSASGGNASAAGPPASAADTGVRTNPDRGGAERTAVSRAADGRRGRAPAASAELGHARQLGPRIRTRGHSARDEEALACAVFSIQGLPPLHVPLHFQERRLESPPRR